MIGHGDLAEDISDDTTKDLATFASEVNADFLSGINSWMPELPGI